MIGLAARAPELCRVPLQHNEGERSAGRRNVGSYACEAQRASCDRRARLSALHLRICRPGRANLTGNAPIQSSELLAGGS